MDILALRSTVTSTNTIYCNFTVVSLFDETVSSRVVNFSDGSDILVSFYSSSVEHDALQDVKWSTANHGRYQVLVTDCYGTASPFPTIETFLHEITFYRANPQTFLYEASFQELDILLSNDRNFDSDMSSRAILLCEMQKPILLPSNYEIASTLLNDLEISDFRRILPTCLEYTNTEPALGVQFFIVLIAFWISCKRLLHILLSYVTILILSNLNFVLEAITPILRASSVTFFGSIVDKLRYCSISSIEQSINQVESSSILSEEKYYAMIENASGNIALEYMSWSCDAESESEASTVDINCNRSRSPSCDTSKIDSEAASDLCITVDIPDMLLGYPTSRISTKALDTVPIAIDEALVLDTLQHKANSDIYSEVIVPNNSIEVAFLAGCSIDNSLFPKRFLISVPISQLFPLDWEQLLLTMPDTTCTGDYNCTTSDSRTLSACSSRDEKTFPQQQSVDDVNEKISQTKFATPVDSEERSVCTSSENNRFLESKDMSSCSIPVNSCNSIKKEDFPSLVYIDTISTTTELFKSVDFAMDDSSTKSELGTSPVCLSGENENSLKIVKTLSCFPLVNECSSVTNNTLVHRSNTTIEVDVAMSPTSHCAQQACLTPSEWQSVNDMPRVNRVPFTNQTQRITPLKEKAKKNKSLVPTPLGRSITNAFAPANGNSGKDTCEYSSSSNSSTSSARFSASKHRREDRIHLDNKLSPKNILRVQADIQRLNLGTSAGEVIDCDLEEIANCNYSDISSHDELQIYEESHPLEAGDESDISCNTFQDIVVDVEQSGYRDRSIDRDRDRSRESDSDSDDDLGQFYTPSPLLRPVDNIIAPSPVQSSSSLGYISSYPSIGSSARSHVQRDA